MSNFSTPSGNFIGLIAPLNKLFESPFLKSRAVTWVLSFALLPFLILMAVMQFGLRFDQSVWILGSYFCCFWAFYFYGLIAPNLSLLKRGMAYLLFTTTCGIPLLLAWQQLPIISSLYGGTTSSSFMGRIIGFVLGVGLFEELCKALPLLFFSLRRGKLEFQECMFLGIMSGLGFALAEVVQYSINYAQETAQLSALLVAQAAGESRNIFGHLNADKFVSKVQSTLPQMMDNYGTILTIQIVRFIPLPLLHAVWTGIVGWFVAASTQHARSRPWVTIGLGIGGVALLHGLYDVFSTGILAIFLAAISILVFLCYLSQGAESLPQGEVMSAANNRIFRCEKCGQNLRVPHQDLEIIVTCPSCRHQFQCK